VLQRTPGTFFVLTYHRGPAPLNTALDRMGFVLHGLGVLAVLVLGSVASIYIFRVYEPQWGAGNSLLVMLALSVLVAFASSFCFAIAALAARTRPLARPAFLAGISVALLGCIGLAGLHSLQVGLALAIALFCVLSALSVVFVARHSV
jgi:O-antigen/teichoic acid export membrane protein